MRCPVLEVGPVLVELDVRRDPERNARALRLLEGPTIDGRAVDLAAGGDGMDAHALWRFYAGIDSDEVELVRHYCRELRRIGLE